jgi:hypothetical protein
VVTPLRSSSATVKVALRRNAAATLSSPLFR